MKKFFAALCAALAAFFCTAASAQLPPYGLLIQQADVSGTFFWGRYWTPPNPSASYFLMYDGPTMVPALAALSSNIVFSGGVLSLNLASGDITTALGYTPYSAANPAGYLTSTALVPYATTTALTTGLAGKFNNPTGTVSQCVRGDGSVGTCPGNAARSFATPARALNTCFQISATRDAMVSYAVDVTTTVTLGGTPEGAVYLRTYTNSGCSTGQVGVISGSSGQPTTLTVSVGQAIKGTANLYGVVQGGLWARIETTNVSGTPTFAIRTDQQEVQL